MNCSESLPSTGTIIPHGQIQLSQVEKNDKTSEISSEKDISSSTAQENMLPKEGKFSLLPLPVQRAIKVTILLLILGGLAGIGYGIYYAIDHFSEKSTFSDGSRLTHDDGSITRIVNAEFTDNNLFSENVHVKATVMFAMDSSGRRLQEGEGSRYQTSVNIQEFGLITTINQNGSVSFQVDPEVFMKAAGENQEQINRFLQEDEGSTTSSDEAAMIASLQEAFNFAVGNLGDKTIKFTQSSFFTYKFNQEKNQIQQVMASSGSDGANQAKRLLGWKKIFKKIKTIVVKKIVAPVIEVVRKHGPQIGAAIGAVVGGVTGFVAGGPAGIWPGAIAGIKKGYEYGSIAQSIVKACIPENSLTIRCEAQKVAIETAKKVASYAVGSYIKGTEVKKAI